MTRSSVSLVLFVVALASLVSPSALTSGGGPTGHRPKPKAIKKKPTPSGILGLLAPSPTSAVSLRRVKTSSGRSVTLARRALLGKPLSKIRGCWKRHRVPAVSGRVDYELTLDKLGRVRGLSMRGHTLARSVARRRVGVKLPKLRACVERPLRAARFGAGPGGAKVSLSLRFGSALSSLFGSSQAIGLLSSGSLSGGSLSGGVGGLIGSKGTGYGGLGLRGTGRRGGGTGSGTIGLGRFTIGKGSGYGLDRRRAVPIATPVYGALDKQVIRRVIRRDLPQIRYCYQQQLLKQPKLAGKLVVRFVIGASGRVLSVQIRRSIGIGASSLEQCVVGRFKRMRFPSPKGGGGVTVTYPLNFTPST